MRGPLVFQCAHRHTAILPRRFDRPAQVRMCTRFTAMLAPAATVRRAPCTCEGGRVSLWCPSTIPIPMVCVTHGVTCRPNSMCTCLWRRGGLKQTSARFRLLARGCGSASQARRLENESRLIEAGGTLCVLTHSDVNEFYTTNHVRTLYCGPRKSRRRQGRRRLAAQRRSSTCALYVLAAVQLVCSCCAGDPCRHPAMVERSIIGFLIYMVRRGFGVSSVWLPSLAPP
jgi:hypothetical protein